MSTTQAPPSKRTPPTNRTTHLLRRLAPIGLALGLLGAACSTTPTTRLELGSAPSGPGTAPTLPAAADPGRPIEGGETAETTSPATPSITAPVTAPTTAPATDDESAAPTTEAQPAETAQPEPPVAGDEDEDEDEDEPTEPTQPEPAAGHDGEQTEEPTGGVLTFPAQVAHAGALTGTHLAGGGGDADPVNLVYQGRGTHVADLLVEIGSVAGGSTLIVDYGDGTVDNRGLVVPGDEVLVTHAFEPTLTFDNQTVVATVIEPTGTEHRDRLTFGTRSLFELSFSPITVEALSACDTFGKGDFVLSWNNGDGDHKAEFKLGAGDAKQVDRFGGVRGRFAYDDEAPFDFSLSEEDPWGAWFFAPWKWDGGEFYGAPPHTVFRPVRQVGDHTFTITRSSSTDEGVDGDDDCATLVTFDVTLDMLDD